MNTSNLMPSVLQKFIQKTRALPRIGPILAKITTRKAMMTKISISLLVILSLHLLTCDIHALSMSTLPPREAVVQATDIAVGVVQVSHENGLIVRFQPKQVLKGTLKTNKLYTINYADEYNRVGLKQVMEKIAAYAEGKPAVLFLGYLHTDGETLVPDSLDKAVWPRNTAALIVQTPDTLEECITFVKAVMANPEIKLKNVNGRRVLPDGYTLPATTNAPRTEPKEKSKAAVPQMPPSALPQASRKSPLAAAAEPAKGSATLWVVGAFTAGAVVWLWVRRKKHA